MVLRHPRLLGLSLLPILAGAPALQARGAVELKIADREAFVNEALQVAIEVSDFQACDAPAFPELATCTVRPLGSAAESSQISIFNGRRSERHTRTYNYELTPRVVGELVIPPIAVQVDGQTLQTRATKVQVRPSNAGELFSVDVSAGRRRLYVGQRVPFTMTIWVRPPRFGSQEIDAGTMLRQLEPINLKPFPLQVNSVTKSPRPGGDPADMFYAYKFVTDLIADRPGSLSFDDIEVGLAYPTRTAYRNLRTHAVVEPAEVLPIPMDGRPADFNGAVGLFSIDTAAKPGSVRVGDPIELTIEVYGDGPVETLPPPLISAHTRLNEGFRVPDQVLTGEVKEGKRRFTVTIRARRDDVTEIPPIEYPYFDPDAERFVTARSQAIPLTVAPAAEAAVPEVPNGETRRGSPPGATLEALDGLRDIETGETQLLATTHAVTPGLIAAVALVPPAAFLLTWLGLTFVQRQAADPARRRRQTALRRARREIAAARAGPPRAMARAIVTALSGYLADRFDQPPARFTGPAAIDFLRQRKASAAVVTQWTAVIARCEEASFAAGTPADVTALSADALKCLIALEREKL